MELNPCSPEYSPFSCPDTNANQGDDLTDKLQRLNMNQSPGERSVTEQKENETPIEQPLTVHDSGKRSSGHQTLVSWLNKNMRIEVTDGRILTGVFQCTDRDGNVILGCSEYIKPKDFIDQPKQLGLVMVPGRHIVSIHYDPGVPQEPVNPLNVSTNESSSSLKVSE